MAAVPIQVFATDVSESAVEQARVGLYPEGIATDGRGRLTLTWFGQVWGREKDLKPGRVGLFAGKVSAFAERGARILGGCCGSTPEHLATLAQALGR